MSKTETQPEYALAQREKTSYPWYIANIDKYLVPNTRRLLSEYSGIPPDEQSAHVHRIRDQAFAIRSYPCTGLGIFLVPFIPHTPVYQTLLSRLKRGDLLLDIGCFIGSDLRQLAFDGAPTANMVGMDIVSHWEVGFDMYRDRQKFAAKSIEADVLGGDERLSALRGMVDLCSISAVLHQFDLETQETVCRRLIEFSRAGCLLFGYQAGVEEAFEDEGTGKKIYFQSPETFKAMVERAADDTGTQWDVRCEFLDWGTLGWDVGDMAWLQGKRLISFVAERKA